MERSGDPAVAVHVHQAPKDCGLEDEAAWRSANPALGTVKSVEYMKFASRRASATPSEAPAFRSLDLNQPGTPTRQTIVALDRWVVCSAKRQPERSGNCFLGFDLGGSASLTAAAVYWPDVSRLECYAGVGDDPDLEARGQGDGVADLYRRMLDRGELRTWPGRVTPAGPFLEWVAELLDGESVVLALADRYRQAEAKDALDAAGVGWPVEWRAQGSGKDGSADVRAFSTGGRGWVASARRLIGPSGCPPGIRSALGQQREPVAPEGPPTRAHRRTERGGPGGRRGGAGGCARGRGFILSHTNLRERE